MTDEGLRVKWRNLGVLVLGLVVAEGLGYLMRMDAFAVGLLYGCGVLAVAIIIQLGWLD